MVKQIKKKLVLRSHLMRKAINSKNWSHSLPLYKSPITKGKKLFFYNPCWWPAKAFPCSQCLSQMGESFVLPKIKLKGK